MPYTTKLYCCSGFGLVKSQTLQIEEILMKHCRCDKLEKLKTQAG